MLSEIFTLFNTQISIKKIYKNFLLMKIHIATEKNFTPHFALF